MQNLSLPDTRIANAKRITYTSLVGGGGRARTQTLASNAIRSLGLEVFGPRVLAVRAVRARACVWQTCVFTTLTVPCSQCAHAATTDAVP